LLIIAVLLVFGQTLRHEFVNYDDNEYVYENAAVMHGVTAEGISWVFTHRVSAQWTPLTLLSLMADAQLFSRRGAGPPDLARLAAGMHAVNLALHAANAVLLFLVLRSMTGRVWPSAMAAAVFAVHPLHVESVAWITERKDVLSGLFGLLALAAYVRYARRPSAMRYLLVAGALALGLIAKPMLVTWPLVFLLLDYWPLRRPLRAGLLLEKVPLLLLVAASAAAAVVGQWSGDAVFSLETVPLGQRIARAAELYVAYLGKTFWPANLAALYGEPPMASYWPAIAAGALLALLTAGALWAARRTRRAPQPWLAVGWLWYLLTLVPVIGLVRVGSGVMADRFMYLPLIGLCLAVIWAAKQAIGTSPYRQCTAAVASLLVLASLGTLAWRQASYWKDSETLWKRTLVCTSGTWAVHNNLGIALDRKGQFDEAIAHFRKAVEIRPNFAQARFNLGNALMNAGQVEQAIAEFRKATSIEPDHAAAHSNLGIALDRIGQFADAVAELEKAIQINPDSAEAHNSLGIVLARHGQYDKAIAHFQTAIQIRPDFADARRNLNVVWGQTRVPAK